MHMKSPRLGTLFFSRATPSVIRRSVLSIGVIASSRKTLAERLIICEAVRLNRIAVSLNNLACGARHLPGRGLRNADEACGSQSRRDLTAQKHPGALDTLAAAQAEAGNSPWPRPPRNRRSAWLPSRANRTWLGRFKRGWISTGKKAVSG